MQKEQSFIDDLVSINLMYLMYATQLAKTNPTEAIWVLGMTHEELNVLSTLTPDHISQLSKCGRLLMRIKMPNITNNVVAIGEQTILMSIFDDEQ